MTFTPLDSTTLQPYLPWILDDPETRQHTGADEETIAYHFEHGHIWLARRDSEAVALILDHAELNGEIVISLIVAPLWRRKGIGIRVLNAFVELHSDKTLLASIHAEHSASLSLFISCGFILFSPSNKYGYGVYAHVPHLKESFNP